MLRLCRKTSALINFSTTPQCCITLNTKHTQVKMQWEVHKTDFADSTFPQGLFPHNKSHLVPAFKNHDRKKVWLIMLTPWVCMAVHTVTVHLKSNIGIALYKTDIFWGYVKGLIQQSVICSVHCLLTAACWLSINSVKRLINEHTLRFLSCSLDCAESRGSTTEIILSCVKSTIIAVMCKFC